MDRIDRFDFEVFAHVGASDLRPVVNVFIFGIDERARSKTLLGEANISPVQARVLAHSLYDVAAQAENGSGMLQAMRENKVPEEEIDKILVRMGELNSKHRHRSMM